MTDTNPYAWATQALFNFIEKQGMTAQAMAEKAGFPATTLTGLKSADAPAPSFEVFEKIAEAQKTTVAEILSYATGARVYTTIIVETRGKVGLITLNRPKALNALNSTVIADINHALDAFERDAKIGCIVITGSEKAFAAGADIKEMQGKDYPGTYLEDFITSWDRVAARRKPIIAAVAGFALGGGCELAMMCDIIICADNAKFGQPEINLGVMPGAGGTQRLTRFVGKSKAMEMCLTGRFMDAAEAERSGLVSRVVPAADLMAEALKVADTIASKSLPIVMMTKESVNRAYETTLAEGVRFERRVFHAMFATDDQKEGMTAFVEKRAAAFRDR
jgi:enoyl-CoA hydratase